MLTSDAVDRYVRSTRGVRSLSNRTLIALWADLPTDAVAARNLLVPAVQNLTVTFGELASIAAADFYEEARGRAGFSAVLADPVPLAKVEASTRWAIDPLFSETPDSDAALGRVQQIVDRFATNQGHETVFVSGSRDPAKPKFARVPVGDTCAWCRLMASRGAVYRSEASAKFRRSHAKCDCKVSPVFDGDELPYDQEGLLAEYRSAKKQAETGSVKSVAAAMREGSPIN